MFQFLSKDLGLRLGFNARLKVFAARCRVPGKKKAPGRRGRALCLVLLSYGA